MCGHARTCARVGSPSAARNHSATAGWKSAKGSEAAFDVRARAFETTGESPQGASLPRKRKPRFVARDTLALALLTEAFATRRASDRPVSGIAPAVVLAARRAWIVRARILAHAVAVRIVRIGRS